MSLCCNSLCRVVLLCLCLSSTALAPLQLHAQQLQTFPFGKCRPSLAFRPIPKGGQRVLEAGSIILARLREPLTSKKAKVGQPVIAFVSTAIADEKGVLLVPRNSRIIGQIDRVHRARSNQPAMLEIGFNTLQRCWFPNGLSPSANAGNEKCSGDEEFVQLSGMMVPLTPENCRQINEDGLVVGKKPGAKNTLKFVGGGAAGGAMLGGLAVGSLTGTGIGAGVGAGIGLVLALTSKGGDVQVPTGSLFGIELTSPLPLRAQDQTLTYPKPPPPKKPKPKPRPRPNYNNNCCPGCCTGGIYNPVTNPVTSGPNPPAIRDPERQRVENIQINLNRLVISHSQYLSINRQDANCSRTLRALIQLRKPLNDYFRTSNSQARKLAISQLYDGSIVVNDTIADERGQTCRLSETHATRWQSIQNAINEVASYMGVNL